MFIELDERCGQGNNLLKKEKEEKMFAGIEILLYGMSQRKVNNGKQRQGREAKPSGSNCGRCPEGVVVKSQERIFSNCGWTTATVVLYVNPKFLFPSSWVNILILFSVTFFPHPQQPPTVQPSWTISISTPCHDFMIFLDPGSLCTPWGNHHTCSLHLSTEISLVLVTFCQQRNHCLRPFLWHLTFVAEDNFTCSRNSCSAPGDHTRRMWYCMIVICSFLSTSLPDRWMNEGGRGRWASGGLFSPTWWHVQPVEGQTQNTGTAEKIGREESYRNRGTIYNIETIVFICLNPDCLRENDGFYVINGSKSTIMKLIST